MDSSDSSMLSYKHQQLPSQPQHRSNKCPHHCQMESFQEETDDHSDNPVYNQIMRDLRQAQKMYGDNDSKVADAWNALGLVKIHMQRDIQGAICCHEHALRIFQEQKLAKETAITLIDLGYCCERMEHRDDALLKYQQALEILEAEKMPENHPQVSSTKRAITRMMRI
ncbi:expressed tetratricopeptide repeat protein [Nitzschia inconspicua]|uniref:Tetratricopeptide repeat protein n=1 Tax=Nitzschia inconspicua TaxID=303405 RepID=A0A9K3LQP9_9STRA|nr:tetratricopeptide repeat protein [Nitzschia inconspicua]KAG7366174.1 expressed tetratricopeptide repeat protein [Nitzschia inconspicua]